MLKHQRTKGIALILALLTMVVLAGIGTLLFARTVNEIRHSADDVGIVQTLLLARGGANLGGSLLTGAIRDELNEIVNVRSSTVDCWSFGEGACSTGAPTVSTVVADLTGSNSVATLLQDKIDELLCEAPVGDFGGEGTVQLRVYVTTSACGLDLPPGVEIPSGRFVGGGVRPANQDYAIPFVLVSEAVSGEYRRNVVMQGEYQFTVGRVTFAQYALFTNKHNSASGSSIWFTNRTLFDGPVHTNAHFRFNNRPWFGHKVTSAGCYANRRTTQLNPSTGNMEERCSNTPSDGAFFYNDSDRLRRNLGANPSFGSNPVHSPELVGGVDWRAEFIPLPTNAYEQQELARNSGIYFGDGVNLSRLEMWAADASGNALAGGATGQNAVYQYVRGTSTSGAVRTFRFDSTGLLQERVGGVWNVALNGDGLPISTFNGVIYADGRIDSLESRPRADSNINSAPPAIAHFAQVTLATTDRIRITSDLKYEDPPCSTGLTRNSSTLVVTPATCENLDAKNVLGIYVQNDNIIIGNNHGWPNGHLNAPDHVAIHGVLMSSTGQVAVEDHDEGPVRGNVRLLGGIIENTYGAFGTFSGSSSTHGYGRAFTYDRRMYSSVSPPYFPTIGLDRVRDVRVFSFGQREQVY